MATAPRERPDHGEPNDVFLGFFYEVGTVVWPQHFRHGISKYRSFL